MRARYGCSYQGLGLGKTKIDPLHQQAHYWTHAFRVTRPTVFTHCTVTVCHSSPPFAVSQLAFSLFCFIFVSLHIAVSSLIFFFLHGKRLSFYWTLEPFFIYFFYFILIYLPSCLFTVYVCFSFTLHFFALIFCPFSIGLTPLAFPLMSPFPFSSVLPILHSLPQTIAG